MTELRHQQESGGSDAGGSSVLSLIRDLQSGRTSGINLSIDDRRRCVEHLSAEGYSVPEIAEILKCNERTIARDRKAIRQANALKVEPGFVEETVGHLMRQAEQSISRLRRMAREKESPLSSRVEAERAAWDVGRELVGTLQRLGYLPMAAAQLKADLRHSLGGLTESAADSGGEDEVLAELARLQVIVDQAGGDQRPRLSAELLRLRSTADRIALADQVRLVVAQAESGLQPQPAENEEVPG